MCVPCKKQKPRTREPVLSKKARPSQTDWFKRSSLSTEEVGMQDKDRAGVDRELVTMQGSKEGGKPTPPSFYFCLP